MLKAVTLAEMSAKRWNQVRSRPAQTVITLRAGGRVGVGEEVTRRSGAEEIPVCELVVYSTLKAPAVELLNAKVTFVPPRPATLVISNQGLVGR